MSKTKERDAEKSSKSTRTSAKVTIGKATSGKLNATPAKTQAPASKPSAKLSAAASAKLPTAPSAKLPAAASAKLPAASAKLPAASAKLPAAAATKASGKLPAAKTSASLKAQSDKADKSDKAEKTEKPEKSDKVLKPEKADKAEKSDKSDRLVKAERSERASERLERAERAERAAAPPLPTKSPFPKDELGKWRVQLLSRRYEISSDIAGLEKDAMEAEDGHTTPNHLAERGSDADLQDVSLGIAGEEKDIIWQIDRALRKIDESEPIPFGLCEFTKEAIPRSRLQLIPWTPLSIEGATHMESKGLQVEDMLVDG